MEMAVLAASGDAAPPPRATGSELELLWSAPQKNSIVLSHRRCLVKKDTNMIVWE